MLKQNMYIQIIKSFYHMSLSKQIEFIRELKDNLKLSEYNDYTLYKYGFNEYYYELSSLVENKNKYLIFNSSKKRYLRFNFFNKIIKSSNYYDIEMDEPTLPKYILDTIEDSKADTYIYLLKTLSIEEKDDFIETLDEMKPQPLELNISVVVEEYDQVMVDVLGFDLYNFYSVLSEKDKYKIIRILSQSIDNTCGIKKRNLRINDRNAIKNIKRELLNIGRKKLLNKNIDDYIDYLSYYDKYKLMHIQSLLYNAKSIGNNIGLDTNDFEKNYYLILSTDSNRLRLIELNCFKRDDNSFNYIFYKGENGFYTYEDTIETIQIDLMNGEYINHHFRNDMYQYTTLGQIDNQRLLGHINNKNVDSIRLSKKLIREIKQEIEFDKDKYEVLDFNESKQVQKKKTIQRFAKAINSINK